MYLLILEFFCHLLWFINSKFKTPNSFFIIFLHRSLIVHTFDFSWNDFPQLICIVMLIIYHNIWSSVKLSLIHILFYKQFHTLFTPSTKHFFFQYFSTLILEHNALHDSFIAPVDAVVHCFGISVQCYIWNISMENHTWLQFSKIYI